MGHHLIRTVVDDDTYRAIRVRHAETIGDATMPVIVAGLIRAGLAATIKDSNRALVGEPEPEKKPAARPKRSTPAELAEEEAMERFIGEIGGERKEPVAEIGEKVAFWAAPKLLKKGGK